MQSNIKIRNGADCCIIDIEGTIGIPEEWQFEHPDQRVATYERFREAVKAIAGVENPEVLVNIRSTGGDVNDALLIYEALLATGAHITTRCYGYTASAATLIAQAATEGCREIAAGALYLIHNSICSTEGNAEELTAQTELLRKTDARLAEIYAARSGRTKEEFAALMAENNGRGRWLSPEEALEAGLADVIVEHHSPAEKSSTEQGSASEEPSSSQEKSSSDEKLSAAASIARGWQRLKAALSAKSDDRKESEKPEKPEKPEKSGKPVRTEGPKDVDERNILHFDTLTDAPAAGSLVALKEGQRAAMPTRTAQREDPSTRETARSANAEAYAADARRIGTLR